MRQHQLLITPWSAEVGATVLTIWAVCISSLFSFLREFSSLSFSRSISFSCLSSCCTRSWKFTTCFHSVWTLLLNHNSGAVYLGHLAGRSKPATIYNFFFFLKRHFEIKNFQCAGVPLLTQPPFDWDGMQITRPLCKLISGRVRAALRVQLQETINGFIYFLNVQLTVVNVRQRVCDRHTIPLFICVEHCITSANCLRSTFRCFFSPWGIVISVVHSGVFLQLAHVQSCRN